MAKIVNYPSQNNHSQNPKKMESRPQRKNNWLNILKIVGEIIAIIGGIIIIYNFFKDNTTPPIIATFSDTPSQYMIQRDDRIIDEPYGFNYTNLNEYNERYSVTDNCITSLLVSNNSDHDYDITKFSFYATNIVKDYSPYFEGYFDCDLGTPLLLNLHNDGWGNATNIRIELTDKSGLLSEYFFSEDLIWSINSLSPNELKNIPLLTNDNLLKYPDSEVIIDGILTITCNETDSAFTLDEYTSFIITPEGLSMCGGGDDSLSAYGIYIDTDKSTYAFSQNVLEPIKAHSNINLPICFYPNMSCNMTFYIELEIFTGTKTKTIRTEEKNMYFRVSHTATDYINYHNNNFEFFPDETFVSYPFTVLLQKN